ncbi:MAG: beta-N-acetylhexosaminidase [Lachnospiraceae bacterium]|nr:beta-N-acetylhexosaminidase [Lachnospiraceae bacterium]
MAALNIIPAVNGWKSRGTKTLKVETPLLYMGCCPEAPLFPLEKDTKGLALLLIMQGEEIDPEGYELEIDTDKIVIHYADDAGRFYALTTLFEMIRVYKGEIPCGHAADVPKYDYRGFMLDVSRHFFDVAEVKKILDEMAAMKLNRFHWHLSNDQGYRIESLKFPKLNEISARRTEPDGKESYGLYTREEIREVVSYAAERYIEVIPEIDLPGHTSAIAAAYPELTCKGEPVSVKNAGGIYSEILCPGKEETLNFLKELLEEVTELFPGEYFHIGGDEAPKAAWKVCPHCQAKIRELGLNGEEDLQGWITTELIRFLKEKGKTAIGWNEMLYSGAKEGAVAQYWNEMKPGETRHKKQIEQGQKFIMSMLYGSYCDYPYAMVSLKAMYDYDETQIRGVKLSEDQLLGMEIPVWTEHIADAEKLEAMIFPRIETLAEHAWSMDRDFEDFLQRMQEREVYLQEKGYHVTPVKEADIRGMEGIPRFFEGVKQFAASMGGGAKNMELDEETRKQLEESGKEFMKGFLMYTFTPEEMGKIMEAAAGMF